MTPFLPAPDTTAARKKMASIMNDMSVIEAFTVCISNISMSSRDTINGHLSNTGAREMDLP